MGASSPSCDLQGRLCLGFWVVPDTCQRFMYQKDSQAFGDSRLGLATLRLSALHCFALHIKGSLEGREEGRLDELSPQP